jgi:hypothetical protein
MAKKKKENKELSQMGKLTAGYDKFIKGKETVSGGKKVFIAALNKAATIQPLTK